MENLIVVDVGTSSIRGIIYNREGSPLFSSQSVYTPDYISDTVVEQPPSSFLHALIEILRRCAVFFKQHKEEPVGISITAQRSSFIPINKNGEPVRNTIMWQDRRSASICARLKNSEDFIYKKTGLRLSPVPLAPKITWYIENEPNLDNVTYKYMTIVDYLNFKMTGEYKTDYTYGSRTLLMNIHTLDWDKELLKLFGISKEKMCELIPQNSIIGRLTKDFASLVGLKEGLPVISAGGDQQCSTLGTGCIHHADTQITIGTGSYITVTSNTVILDSKAKTICSVSSVPGKYVLEASVLTGAGTYNWYHRTFYPENSDYETMNSDAASSLPGSNHLILLPHFQGKGSPDWNPNAKGVFYGVHTGCTRGDFARAILEGIAAELKDNLTILEQYTDKIASVHISGGLTKCELFNEIQADMYNLPLLRSSNAESTALGACISGLAALRLYSSMEEALLQVQKNDTIKIYFPNTNNKKLYEEFLENRTLLYHSLYPEDSQ